MDNQEIQTFIDETIYDFQTIEHSLVYQRIKETVPVLLQVMARIQVFKSQVSTESDPLKGIFQEDFWDKETFAKLKVLSQRQGVISEKDLQEINYQNFLEAVRVWTYKNIFQLRKIIKSPRQNKFEIILIALATAIGALLLASIILLKFFFQDWGLKGDFYQGQNFERQISSGISKVIDFGYYLEMSPRMPYEHSSARWQGSLVVPRDGAYTLSVIVDDGVRLVIDNQLLINEWHDNDSMEFDKGIFLSRGEHTIQLDYYNDWEGSILKLYWAFEGGKKEIIPARYLRHKG